MTFLKFARPAILKMMGAGPDELGLREVRARLTTAANNDSDRPHYFRGRLQGDDFTTIGRQESHALFGLSRANALARLPPASHFAAGECIMVELLPSAD